jgi:hypothetical protein
LLTEPDVDADLVSFARAGRLHCGAILSHSILQHAAHGFDVAETKLAYERGSILCTDGVPIRAKGVVGLVDDRPSLFVAAVDGTVDAIVDYRCLARLAYTFTADLQTVTEEAIIAFGVCPTIQIRIHIAVGLKVRVGEDARLRATSAA